MILSFDCLCVTGLCVLPSARPHEGSQSIGITPSIHMPDSDKKSEAPKKKICCSCPDTKVGKCAAYTHVPHHLPSCDTCNLRKSEMSALASTVRRCWLPPTPLQYHIPPGAEAPQCQPLIEAHKQCLRAEGFNVRATPHAGTHHTNHGAQV